MTSTAQRGSGAGAARVAGAAYLFMVASGILWWVLVGSRVVVAGDPLATAQAVLGREGLFRLGLGIEALMALNLVALGFSHRELLRPAGRTGAEVASWLVLADALLSLAQVLLAFLAFQLLVHRGTLDAPGAAALQALVGLYIDVRIAGHTVAALALHLGLLVAWVQLLRARLLPRALAAAGVLAFALILGAELANVLVPGSPPDLMTGFGPWGTLTVGPSIVLELVAGGWLLARGVGPGAAPLRPAG